MAAPTFQAAGTFQAGGAVQLTVPWPAHQADDIGILVIESGGAIAALTTASGFVEIPGSPQTTTGLAGGVYWCRATSGAMASVVTGTMNNHGTAVIFTVRGCITTGDPWDVISENVKSVTSTSTSITGDTSTLAECLIAYLAARGSDFAANQYSGEADSTTTNLAERVDNGTIIGNGGGIGVWTADKATAGAYGPMTADLANTSLEVCWSIALKPVSSAVSGTIANTEENDTPAFTGTVANPVTGTIAVTEEADTSAIAAVETFSGTIAATETDDTSTISGSVANPVTGTIATTEGDDSANFSGTVTAAGVTGTIAVTEEDDTSAFSGNSTVPGTMVTTEDNDSGAFAGTVANPITGTAAPIEDDDTSAFTGLISNQGTTAVTEDDDTANLVGVVANQVTGTIAVTEDDDTATFTGTGATGLNLPATATITDADNSGTIRDRSPVGVLSSADRTGTIRR